MNRTSTDTDLGKTLIFWGAGLALASVALVAAAFWLFPATGHHHALTADEATREPAATAAAVLPAAVPSAHEIIAPSTSGPPETGCTSSNKQGACSPTQAVFVRKDPKCYACMVQKGCIDDAPADSLAGVKTFGDTGLECGDLGAGTDPGDEKRCLDVLACAVSTDCSRAPAPGKINASDNCYCGKETGNDCLAGKASGACKAAYETASKSKEPRDVIQRMANPNVPLGKANTMIQCAVNNACTACY
jgi:hypothetical protein